MGNYVFDADVLRDVVTHDAADDSSAHDMGGDIVPSFVNSGDGYVYDFSYNEIPGATQRDRAYWRDVGTIDAYYEAHMDLVAIHPIFNLYNEDWPIYTTGEGAQPPAKFVHNESGRLGTAVNSMVSAGTVISGAHVEGSVVSPRGFIHSYAHVADSVLLDRVIVGRKAVVERAILDKHVVIDDGVEVGVDHDADRARGFYVSESGIVVVPRGTHVTNG